jgi:hypothetical protein
LIFENSFVVLEAEPGLAAEAKTEESIILVLAPNRRHIKIRSHHHILVTQPENNMGIILWDLE